MSTAPMNGSKKYKMYNKKTKVTVECTENFILAWIARGFEILELELAK